VNATARMVDGWTRVVIGTGPPRAGQAQACGSGAEQQERERRGDPERRDRPDVPLGGRIERPDSRHRQPADQESRRGGEGPSTSQSPTRRPASQPRRAPCGASGASGVPSSRSRGCCIRVSRGGAARPCRVANGLAGVPDREVRLVLHSPAGRDPVALEHPGERAAVDAEHGRRTAHVPSALLEDALYVPALQLRESSGRRESRRKISVRRPVGRP
jgi:hypothetical protein